jgi:hypothetical protein
MMPRNDAKNARSAEIAVKMQIVSSGHLLGLVMQAASLEALESSVLV